MVYVNFRIQMSGPRNRTYNTLLWLQLVVQHKRSFFEFAAAYKFSAFTRRHLAFVGVYAGII